MDFLEIIFWLAALGSVYSYFIYPLLLIPFQYRNKYSLENELDDHDLPLMSFIITAHNEELQIADKISNTLEIDYPPTRFEILVASDGSTDRTNHIVNKFAINDVKLIEVTDRKGKENAQLHAIKQSKGEILIFSDVSTRVEKQSLHRIAQCFSNPLVGAVSSEDRFLTTDGKIAGEGAYVKYEMWLRSLESKAHSLVGLSGSFFACRSAICNHWNINIPSDFNTAINSIKHKRIAISDPKLLGYYPNIKDETKEFARKVRTVLRGMTALFHNLSLLNPVLYGFFSFELFSHKLMRWMVPWFMLLTFITNLLLVNEHAFFNIVFILQSIFYLLAYLAHLSSSIRHNKLIKIIYFFVQANLATARAMLMFLSGKRITKWKPSNR